MREIDVASDTFKEEVANTAQALRQGKVILYPTDTIWGIGCDATNQSAVERVYEIKKRDRNQPLIILVESIARLKTFVPHLHPRIETLLHYHTRPLTIIYQKVQGLPDHILAKDGSMAIRVCKQDFCRSIIRTFGRPIVSTSANTAGHPFPAAYSDIEDAILSEVDHIVDYHRDRPAAEPSIIATYNKKGELDFIRE